MKYKETKLDVIVCPVCGREYLPAEIFIPRSFFGNPSDIARDRLGRIEMFDGHRMDLTENYTCDYCNTSFKVEARVNFKVSVREDDFQEVYSSSLKDSRITLAEN